MQLIRLRYVFLLWDGFRGPLGPEGPGMKNKKKADESAASFSPWVELFSRTNCINDVSELMAPPQRRRGADDVLLA